MLDLIWAGALWAGAFLLFWRWALTWDHDDDDEMYWSFFNPSASPVATPHAFVKILERVPHGGRVLDIGIGSGTYLEDERVHAVIRQRKLRVDGVDISLPNIAIAQARINKHGLQANVTVRVQDARTITESGTYDAVLFMESFPCMPIPLFVDILRHVQHLLKPNGLNFMFHNLTDEDKMGRFAVWLARLFKPSMKLLIGIDFGRLTTKAEMASCLQGAFPGCTPVTEILLSASPTEFDTTAVRSHLAKVKNRWFAFMGHLFVASMSAGGGPQMEQYLITLPRESAQDTARTKAA